MYLSKQETTNAFKALLESENVEEWKMVEELVAARVLTSNTHWCGYWMKVRDSVPYQVVALNTYGSTLEEEKVKKEK